MSDIDNKPNQDSSNNNSDQHRQIDIEAVATPNNPALDNTPLMGQVGSVSWFERIEQQSELIDLVPLLDDKGMSVAQGQTGAARISLEKEHAKTKMANYVATLKQDREGIKAATPFAPVYYQDQGAGLTGAERESVLGDIKSRGAGLISEFMGLRQAIHWKPTPNKKGGKPNKLPLIKTGGIAKADEQRSAEEVLKEDAHYQSMKSALNAHIERPDGEWSGVGVDMRGGGAVDMFCVDLDNVLDHNNPDPLQRCILDNAAGRLARNLIAAGGFPMYSASGTGLHMWLKIPKGMSMPTLYKSAFDVGVEVFYPQHPRAQRFIALTLHPYENLPRELTVKPSLDPKAVGVFEIIDRWMDAEGLSRDAVAVEARTTGGRLPARRASFDMVGAEQRAVLSGRLVRDPVDFYPLAETYGNLAAIIEESGDPWREINRLALANPHLWFEDCAEGMFLQIESAGPLTWRASDGLHEEELSLYRGTETQSAGINDFRVGDAEKRGGKRSPIDLVIDMLYVQMQADRTGEIVTGFPWDQVEGQPEYSKDGELLIPTSFQEIKSTLQEEAQRWLQGKLLSVYAVTPRIGGNQPYAGQIFSRYVCGELMYDAGHGSKGGWRLFDGTVWASDASGDGEAHRRMLYVGTALSRTYQSLTGVPVATTSGNFRNAVLHDAKVIKALNLPESKSFDDQETFHLLGVRSEGKIWDAKQAKLVPPTRDFYLTAAIDGDIEMDGDSPAKDADCSALLDYFCYQFGPAAGPEMFEEFVSILAQHALGGNRWRQIHVLIGSTGSGKSTLSTLIKNVLGKGMSRMMSAETIATNKNPLHASEYLPITKARSVHMEELSGSRNLKAEAFKSLTNSESSLRGMHQDAEDHLIRGSLIIMTNAMPNLTDDAGGAVAKRMRVMELTKSMISKGDGLALINAQLPALRARMLWKMAEICDVDELPEHQLMKAAKGAITSDWNPVAEFFTDVDFIQVADHEELAEARIYVSDAYPVFSEWCRENQMSGSSIPDKRTFSRKLKELIDGGSMADGVDYIAKGGSKRTPLVSGLLLMQRQSHPRFTQRLQAQEVTESFELDEA